MFYALWANGLNQRNHTNIHFMMDKMIEDCPDFNERSLSNFLYQLETVV